jgi:hypothetical protein
MRNQNISIALHSGIDPAIPLTGRFLIEPGLKLCLESQIICKVFFIAMFQNFTNYLVFLVKFQTWSILKLALFTLFSISIVL